jgi:hypothetical protein
MGDQMGVSAAGTSAGWQPTGRAGRIPAGPRVASIREAASLQQAARLVRAGACVAAFVRAVWVLWLDGANRQAVDVIHQIKGEGRLGRPIVTALPAERFVDLLEPDKIAPELRRTFLDPRELEARLGMLCLIRAPIRSAAAQPMPEALVSRTPDGTHWLQSCVITGTTPGAALTRSTLQAGVEWPGITSMNLSGQPEIVDPEQAYAFCRAQPIPLVLVDPVDPQVVRGSFPNIEVGPAGVRLIRAGHFPGHLFNFLLDGADVKLAHAAPAKYPLVDTHSRAAAAHAGAKQLAAEIRTRLESRASP